MTTNMNRKGRPGLAPSGFAVKRSLDGDGARLLLGGLLLLGDVDLEQAVVEGCLHLSLGVDAARKDEAAAEAAVGAFGYERAWAVLLRGGLLFGILVTAFLLLLLLLLAFASSGSWCLIRTLEFARDGEPALFVKTNVDCRKSYWSASCSR